MHINRTASGLTINLDTDELADPYPTLLTMIGLVKYLADNAAGGDVNDEDDRLPEGHTELWDGILGGREPIIIGDIAKAAHDLVSNHGDTDSLPLLDYTPSVEDGRTVASPSPE